MFLLNTMLTYVNNKKRRPCSLACAACRNCRDPAPGNRESSTHPVIHGLLATLKPSQTAYGNVHYRICGHGHDWAFARTEKQIIETAARMWGGIERP